MSSAMSRSQPNVPHPAEARLEQILNPNHPLCRDDIVWALEYIKKKVTEEDPKLMDLPQPRLMQNFRYFADISLMLIQRRNGFDQEADRLKDWVYEAAYGLHSHRSPGSAKKNN
ncbi:hypothetical protein ACFQI7_05045 [Paenibacillus allorhizosphaerae]|uniref:Methyltransferase n=1 Tax=Paenibacillus allorhizosphaerae TaxID=2849866 RepID=A0ABN7TH07_9BACL|nr:hypothetical protein [Paenibacillus allorhizosphaerae]CAG7622342.1 hypothetical protein PAECIP111802_00815 [Paenibacillus allorhizosphaerae]